jgi:hypothetical protein
LPECRLYTNPALSPLPEPLCALLLLLLLQIFAKPLVQVEEEEEEAPEPPKPRSLFGFGTKKVRLLHNSQRLLDRLRVLRVQANLHTKPPKLRRKQFFVDEEHCNSCSRQYVRQQNTCGSS